MTVDLKRLQNLSREELISVITRSYANNCAAFVTDFTRLFEETDGTPFKPYAKQIQLMNQLKPTDRIIVVQKCRQCLHSDTLITIPSESLSMSESYQKTIEELFQEKYCGKIATLNHNRQDEAPRGSAFVTSEVEDIWYTGKQQLWQIELENGEILKATSKHKLNTTDGFMQLRDCTVGTVLFHFKEGLQKIVKFTKLEGLHDTYDMSVKTNNSYFANNIHVHNSGISTAGAVARTFHNTYFGKNPDNVVISSTKVQAQKIMRRVKQCFEELPDFLQPRMVVDTAQEILLPNKSRSISLSSNPHQAKGWTGEYVLDEFASFTDREGREIYTAVYPATTKGGKIIIISTPFGNTGMYYDLATMTLAEISGKDVKFESKKFFIRWEDVPYIVHEVRHNGLFDGLTEEARRQEYELEFVVANLEEQFFNKNFILETLRDPDGTQMPLYTSYTDLGIPIDKYIGNNAEFINKPLDPSYFKKEELMKTYDLVQGGWDVAANDNDSILTVDARLREGYNKFHRIGYFKVNRVSNKFHDTTLQADYIKRIIQCLDIHHVNMDANGLGNETWNYAKKDPIVGKHFKAFKLQLDEKYRQFVIYKQKLTDGKIKMRWEENNLTRDMLTQYTNLRLNKLNLSLKAKGAERDDAPYSGMLAQSDLKPIDTNIYVY